MTKTIGTKHMARMSKMKRIGARLIACSSGSENSYFNELLLFKCAEAKVTVFQKD